MQDDHEERDRGFAARVRLAAAEWQPDPVFEMTIPGEMPAVLAQAVEALGGRRLVQASLRRLEREGWAMWQVFRDVPLPSPVVQLTDPVGLIASEEPLVLIAPHIGPPSVVLRAVAHSLRGRSGSLFAWDAEVFARRQAEIPELAHFDVIQVSPLAAAHAYIALRRPFGTLIWQPDGMESDSPNADELSLLGYPRRYSTTIARLVQRASARIGVLVARGQFDCGYRVEIQINEWVPSSSRRVDPSELLSAMVEVAERAVFANLDQWWLWPLLIDGRFSRSGGPVVETRSGPS